MKIVNIIYMELLEKVLAETETQTSDQLRI